ncbi:MAG: UPF0182 family protein [Acidobacteria bacterium]|nr:UPF0182 family protein [Acidobacteriota bacterium]
MRLRGLPGFLLLIVVALLVVPSATGYYTDWLWFRELGYEQIFTRTLRAQTFVFAATFAVAFSILSFNLQLARRRAGSRPRMIIDVGGRPVTLGSQDVGGLAVPIAAGVALLLGIAGASNWLRWLSFFHAAPFGDRDPLFGRDVGFYVFRLPVYQTLQQQLLFLFILALVGCLASYVLSGNFVLESRPGAASWPRVRLAPSARRHLAALLALVFLLMAWGSWLDIPAMLLTPTDSAVAFGASYADVHATMPFLWASVAVLVVGAGLAVWHGVGGRGWLVPLALSLYLLVSIAGGVYASIVQRLIVRPNEQNVERPFIEHNIAATRRAYAIDRVEERELSGDAELTAADIVENAGTIENVRLWDHGPLLQTFGQIQEIRTYYDFVNVDNDRYTIDGKLRQVMLSVRELNTESMPNPSFVNERLTFTHGYGLTLGPVNQVTAPEGLPVLFIRDIPPVSTVDLRVDRPGVYYGELTAGYVLVNTRQPEFDYPRGEGGASADVGYATTTYEGTGGVPVGSLARRMLFAIRFGSTDILVSNQITRESRIMFHRQIAERVKVLAPFLSYDFDPYPVLSGGRIFWIQDAYTTTSNYPYSTPRQRPASELNYIRNSVKIVTDAYNGTVAFYLSDPDDPLAQTIDRIFPGVLEPLSAMPPELRRHVRYPEELFRTQAQVYQTYHMTNPTVFYNKEDQWQWPVLDAAQQGSTPMQPYYTVMTLPGGKSTEFIQMLPFTPRAKDNLAAWMVARSDGEHYGRLQVFQFPKQKIVYGPRQVVGRIKQDQVISPQITLWNQQGSEVIWGNLLVIPIKESLLYVQPLYLRSPQSSIPELKRVIVAYQSRIVMDVTLTQALSQIFGRSVAAALAPDLLSSTATSVIEAPDVGPEVEGVVRPPGQAASTLGALAAEAKQHYENAVKAQREGDWSTYGEQLRQLERVLEKMQSTP